ncbi:tubulin monoglycylase TTLL3 isoform X2 [Engraulis encrasicolus]|uniref:tubulin monoglycylase TTLL3 isoform X2 n=1 Tax=Engraulis encrasicolus TaxID=184585 RepID=UPI002FD21D35
MEGPKTRRCVQPGEQGENLPQPPERHPVSSSAESDVEGHSDGDQPGRPQQQQSEPLTQPGPDKPSRATSLPPAEVRVRRSLLNLPMINHERLRMARAVVDKALKMRRTFSIQGPYPVVRAALRARGWVERRLPRANRQVVRRRGDDEDDTNDGDDSGDDDDDDDCTEDSDKDDVDDLHNLMSRLVRNELTYFYWTTRRDTIDTRILRKEQMTNHFAKAGTFTTKVGLCVNLRNLQWFDAADPDSFFPRCYRLGAEDEKHAFIEDYRRTACTNLLQFLVEKSHSTGGVRSMAESEVESVFNLADIAQLAKKPFKRPALSLVSARFIESALQVCQDFLDSLEHNDIDISMETPPTMTEQEWLEFIHNYYLVVHDGAEVEVKGHHVRACKDMLHRLQEVCPQLDTDGVHNIWIVKPGAKSRGRGIMCSKRLDEILKLVDSDPTLIKDSKWVVQKYLERPLLVHGTKFDLRQWFLVTEWNPLTIWFYKECYLRFSTQPYSVETMENSVHLCNNSIQKHFQPSQQRHRAVPEDNMWSCEQFRCYLERQGLGAKWWDVVVPGMKSAVVHALQTAQDLVESRRSSFELYGADFMLGRDLRPWLLEINASPTMAPSTSVTARLCAAVQEDTLRVVLDRRVDRNAHTGGFELIYKQAAVDVPQYVGMNLLIEGSQVRKPRPPAPKPPERRRPPIPKENEKDKPDKDKAEKTRPEQARPEQTRPEQARPEQTRPERAPSRKFFKSVTELTFTNAKVPPSPALVDRRRFPHRITLTENLKLPARMLTRSLEVPFRKPFLCGHPVRPRSGRARVTELTLSPTLPLEVFSLHDSDRIRTVVIPTPLIPEPAVRYQTFSQHYRRVLRVACMGRNMQKI